jgi:hypothetical protein
VDAVGLVAFQTAAPRQSSQRSQHACDLARLAGFEPATRCLEVRFGNLPACCSPGQATDGPPVIDRG